jgi:hypothetical protein
MINDSEMIAGSDASFMRRFDRQTPQQKLVTISASSIVDLTTDHQRYSISAVAKATTGM